MKSFIALEALMDWLNDIATAAREKLGAIFPSLNPVDAAKEFLSEAVAQRIREEANTKAYALLSQAHRSVVRTLVWQNALLLASLVPVYFLQSALPFYVAYTAVAGYSLYSLLKYRQVLTRLLRTRSIHATLSHEVLEAIQAELTQRQFYERKAVEWLGPDLRKLSDDIARRLKPDVLVAATNMTVTLLLAFVAFRLFAIPTLEHTALLAHPSIAAASSPAPSTAIAPSPARP